MKNHTVDTAQVDFLTQVRYAATSQIIISSTPSFGAAMHMLHMPIGTDLCCTVVELLSAGGTGGHSEMARSMGIDYLGIRDLVEVESAVTLGKTIAKKILPRILLYSQSSATRREQSNPSLCNPLNEVI